MDSCNFDTAALNCTDPLLKAITWPDMKRTECTFDRVLCKKIDPPANTPAIWLSTHWRLLYPWILKNMFKRH